MKTRYLLKIAVIAVCCGMSNGVNAQDKNESEKSLVAFPAAPAGSGRYVIPLPPLDNEQDAKIEIIAGRNMTVDCNTHWFGGSLTAGTVEGWGFNYYRLTASDTMVGTRRGCLDHSKREEFVQIRGEGFIVRYNSRVPLVIYVKKGIEIHYRVWKPLNEIHTARSG